MSEKTTPDALEALLRRAMRQLDKWALWYGNADHAARGQLPLPPVGDFRLADDITAALATAEAALPAATPKPLDDPRLQQLFGDAIEGALAFGFQQNNKPPQGHWLERFWNIGTAEAARPAQVVESITERELRRALNYMGRDAELGIPDFKIAAELFAVAMTLRKQDALAALTAQPAATPALEGSAAAPADAGVGLNVRAKPPEGSA